MRTHRKIVVVDGRVAFTGGINITDEEDESLRPDAYRDLHLRLEGEVVRSVQQVFVEDWVYATGQQRKDFQGTRLWSALEANIRAASVPRHWCPDRTRPGSPSIGCRCQRFTTHVSGYG